MHDIAPLGRDIREEFHGVQSALESKSLPIRSSEMGDGFAYGATTSDAMAKRRLWLDSPGQTGLESALKQF